MPTPTSARALISRDVNKAMANVHAQKRAGIDFSLSEELRKGVEISSVTSNNLKRAIGHLGIRPPFRDPAEAELLGSDLAEALEMAENASCIWDAIHEVGSLVTGLDAIVVSRTGALAVRCVGATTVTDSDIDIIRQLDDGNFQIVADPYEHIVDQG